jgi:hypothetical protein
MGDITISLTKERAIEIIARDGFSTYCDTDFIRVDIDTDIEQQLDDIRSQAEFSMTELKENEKDINKLIKDLNKLAYHEILELGESKDLWTQGERQKRLF